MFLKTYSREFLGIPEREFPVALDDKLLDQEAQCLMRSMLSVVFAVTVSSCVKLALN